MQQRSTRPLCSVTRPSIRAVTDGDEQEPRWHEHKPLIYTAGAAAVALLALLVYAVIHTSRDSSTTPNTMAPATSQAPSVYTTRDTSTTSYAVPSVSTSEDTSAPLGPPSPEDTGGPTSETTSTTTDDPYATTTPPIAGHI